MSIDAVYVEVSQARASWGEAFGLLVQGKLDTNAKKPLLDDVSLDDFAIRVTLVLEIYEAIRPTDPKQPCWSLMMLKAAEVKERLVVFRKHANSLVAQLRPHLRESVILKDANGNFSIQFWEAQNNFNNWDASGTFREMNAALQALSLHLATLLPLCKTEGAADLAERATALADLGRQAEAARNEAKKLSKEAEKSASAAADKSKQTQDSLAQAEASLSKIQAAQQTAQQDQAAVATLVQQIKTTGASSDTLEQQITGYKSKFEAFQSQLDARHVQFVEFEKNTKAAEEANKKREAEVDRIIEASDKMITGATTAGLADSMEKTRKRYEERMGGAKFGFYIAVGLLVASTVPLVVHLLPSLFGALAPSLGPKVAGDPWEILGKVILMVPATWLTVFFNKSYSEFFHLEREYAHKAALAMSVDGFKRQAKKYDEEIAAEVFMEIRSNPADRPSPEPASHPLYDILAKKVFEFVSKDKKGDAK